MSARQTNNVEHLLISTAKANGAGSDIAVTTTQTLTAGEIGAFTPAGLRITQSASPGVAVAAAAGMEFYLALGGSSLKTPVIKAGAITSASAKVYTAATQQLDYIGYNGSANSIEVFDNNLYMGQVYIEEFLASSTDGRYIKHFQYESDATATQSEIALGLAKSGNFNFSREAKNSSGNAPIVFEALCNDALATGEDFDETITIVKGSAVISNADATPTYNTGTALAVGDYIRLGATSTTAVALSSAVYKVTAISGVNITLDRPVMLASGSYVTGSDYTQVIPAASGLAADWGVSLTGQAKDHKVGKEFHGVNRWSLNVKDAGSTVVANSTVATEGLGNVNQVKDLEWFANGDRGEYFRMGEPTIYNYTSAIEAAVTGFDSLSITVANSDLVGFQNNVSPMTITLMTDEDVPAFMSAANTGLADILEIITGEADLLA